MIKLGINNIGQHIIRFYPNIENLKQSTHEVQHLSYEGKSITKNEYWNLKCSGKNPFHMVRWHSYAMVDDVYGLFQYGKIIKTLVQCCMKGSYYKSENGYIYEELPFQDEDTPEDELMKFELVSFKPFNIFDLQSDVAIKFEIRENSGFADFYNFELIHDNRYIIFKSGDDKEKIKDFLTSHIEKLPETLINEKT